MSILWPVTLPQYLETQGLEGQLANRVIRSDTDAGPPKVRQRFTGGVEPLAGTMTMTTAQWAILKTFFYSTTGGGSLSFQFNDPATQAPVNVRFKSPPKYAPLGAVHVQVALDLEVLP